MSRINPIPVRRVNRYDLPATGGTVLSGYAAAMGAMVRRGRGAAGSRGPVLVYGGGVRSQVPLFDTPAVAGNPAYARGGVVSVIRPGSTRLGDDVAMSSDAKARSELTWPFPITGMTLKSQASKSKCQFGTSYGFNGSTAWVDKGCRGTFAIVPNRAGGAGDDEANRISTATTVVNRFVDSLRGGQVDPTSAAPGGADLLPSPTNAVNNPLYATYQAAVARISGARLEGQMMWALTHAAGGTTAVTPAPTGTTDAAAPTAYVDASPTNPLAVGVEPVPIQTGSGYDIYGSDGGTAAASGGPTTYIPAPGSAAPQKAPPQSAPGVKKPAALAAGGLALVGLAIFAYARHKKKARVA